MAEDAEQHARASAARDELLGLRAEALAFQGVFQDRIDVCSSDWRRSAENLVHYLALRRQDLRPLQLELSRLGLSSLGRMEAHALATLDAVIARLDDLIGDPPPDDALTHDALTHEEGGALLDQHAAETLGREPRRRSVRIMVTMPSEASSDPEWAGALLRRGMDLARVNSAHDDAAAWRRMIGHVRAAAAAEGRSCPVAFDLAGPKLRTGPLSDPGGVLRVRPVRDALGAVVHPARIRLVPAAGAVGQLLADGTAVVPVVGELTLVPGDEVRLRDARGRRRVLRAVATSEGVELLCQRTVYLVPGTELAVSRPDDSAAALVVGDLPPAPVHLVVRAGEHLVLTASDEPGRPARRGTDGAVVEPARIGCSLPEVIPTVAVGSRVLIDDGGIAGVVRKARPDHLVIEIIRPVVGKVRPEKGINLPDTVVDVPALGDHDVTALTAVTDLVDLVSVSFVQSPDDVAAVADLLDRVGAPNVGLVLKIETRRAFEQLPVLLLEAMRHGRVAVMVARGDLAVEVGFERLAEVQEEILWLCEAAHVPVIWATQVLESLAKGGMPTRAEITDAATGARAECVMLNKGPHIVEALGVLDDVLERMQHHQDKRTGLLRRLGVSDVLPSLAPERT